jgi:DNA-binding CsgD family transcriptional regulator
LEELTPAEYSVLRLYVEGYRQSEIAAARRTSRRTVANQLAAVFRKFRVSGRAEFMARLVGDYVLAARSGTPRDDDVARGIG